MPTLRESFLSEPNKAVLLDSLRDLLVVRLGEGRAPSRRSLDSDRDVDEAMDAMEDLIVSHGMDPVASDDALRVANRATLEDMASRITSRVKSRRMKEVYHEERLRPSVIASRPGPDPDEGIVHERARRKQTQLDLMTRPRARAARLLGRSYPESRRAIRDARERAVAKMELEE